MVGCCIGFYHNMKKLNSYSLWIVFITLYYTTAPQIPFGSQTWQFKISHKWTFLWNKIYMGYFPLPRLITRGYFRGCVVLSISEQRMKTSGNRGLGSDLFRHLWLRVKTPMPLVFPNNRDLCMFISPHLHIVLGETTTDQYWTGGEKCWHLGYLMDQPKWAIGIYPFRESSMLIRIYRLWG